MEEEFEDVTIEEAIAEFEFPELEERIKKAFPDPYTEFDVNELLECIFIKRTSYIWILEADERQERFFFRFLCHLMIMSMKFLKQLSVKMITQFGQKFIINALFYSGNINLKEFIHH